MSKQVTVKQLQKFQSREAALADRLGVSVQKLKASMRAEKVQLVAEGHFVLPVLRLTPSQDIR